MMFGSMPMKLPGSSLKIHYISSQEQLLVTKVFSLQRRPTMASCSITDLTDSCPLPSEMSSQVMENSSGPLPKQNGFQYSLRPPSPGACVCVCVCVCVCTCVCTCVCVCVHICHNFQAHVPHARQSISSLVQYVSTSDIWQVDPVLA